MPKPKELVPVTPGDRTFFLEFYEQYKHFLYFLAGKYTTDPTRREDLVQDSLVRLLKNMESLKKLEGSRMHKYLAMTVRTAFLDSERIRNSLVTLSLEDETLELLMRADLLGSCDPDVSARLDVEKLRKDLPYRDWLLLEGKYIMGYDQEELGQLLGITPDSVRMVLTRAREKARKILRRNESGGEE